jgi:hypothetical protein
MMEDSLLPDTLENESDLILEEPEFHAVERAAGRMTLLGIQGKAFQLHCCLV